MHVGDVVGDFELIDDCGDPRTLTGQPADGPVLLFCHPAASGWPCTRTGRSPR